MTLTPVDWIIIAVYLTGCLFAGLWMRRYVRGVQDFAVAGREMDVNLGIASLDFSFTPGVAYGTYHSIYDSFDWMDRFGGDPTGGSPGAGFSVMAAAARVWGVLATWDSTKPASWSAL